MAARQLFQVPLTSAVKGAGGGRSVRIEDGATKGAVIGVDLLLPDGSRVRADEILNRFVDAGGDSSGGNTLWRLVREIPASVEALAEIDTLGFYVITNDGESATRTITGEDGEIEVSEGGGIGGNPIIGLAEVIDAAVGALLAIERDDFGRVTGTKAATITGTADQIEVANGDAVAGLPTISLADIDDAGGGTLRKFARDGKGRVSGTSAATTDDLTEGAANLYFTDVRAVEALDAVLGSMAYQDKETVDIDGGTLDGVQIGATVPATSVSAQIGVFDGNPIWSGPVGTASPVSNLAIGVNALAARTTATTQLAIGTGALQNNQTANGNTAIGSACLNKLTAGTATTAVGAAAGRDATSVTSSVLLGGNVGRVGPTITQMTAVGASACEYFVGQQAVALGLGALQGSLVAPGGGQFATAVGWNAGISQTGGLGNVYVGARTGSTLTPANANLNGGRNTFVGYATGPGSPTQVSYATALGGEAVVTTSNTVTLGRVTDTTVIGATGNDGSGARLQVTGTIKADGLKHTPASATAYATPALAALSSASASFTVAGAALGDRIEATHSAAVGAGLQVTGRVTAANTVEITFTNTSASALAATAGTLRIWITKP